MLRKEARRCMNVLLADSNRDLLQSYQKLLTMDGHTVTTAFDGAMAVSLLSQQKFDIVLLEERLPRIRNEQRLQFLDEKQTPVIVLTDQGATVKALLKSTLPNAYLGLPFLPADLKALMEAVMAKRRSAETFACCGAEVDIAGFRFAGTQTRLTNGEIDLLRELEKPRRTASKRTRIMIQALNEKLRGLGKHTRIIYEIEKGYRLVNEND